MVRDEILSKAMQFQRGCGYSVIPDVPPYLHTYIYLTYSLSCTRYGMVISRWQIVHHQKGRCEDFEYYRSS
jgi:hypothetical protein